MKTALTPAMAKMLRGMRDHDDAGFYLKGRSECGGAVRVQFALIRRGYRDGEKITPAGLAALAEYEKPAGPSYFQKERQRRRGRRGRYEEMNRCDRCKKPYHGNRYQQISDDPALKAACLADFGRGVGCVCHRCISILLPEPKP
jgi:hypothetical protein